MLIPVVLSGGSGTRLWPLSREAMPKQFLRLVHPQQSMLQTTLSRADGLPNVGSPIVVCNEEHRFLIADQLRQSGVKSAEIILEPAGKGTAIAIATAALVAKRRQVDSDPLLLVLPSDHVVEDVAAFQRAVSIAVGAARDAQLVTFGVVPRYAATGFGYIECGGECEGARPIRRFVEKPDKARAESFFADRSFLWNSGMFLFSADAFFRELDLHAPDIAAAALAAVDGASADLDFIRLEPVAFRGSRAASVDVAVMERTGRAAVVPLDAGWNDVGSWQGVQSVLGRDERGNALRGDVLLEDTRDSLVFSTSRLVAVLGVDDLVVVETTDAVFVCPRDRAEEVRGIVGRLKAESRPESSEQREVHRPWGSYESIDAAQGYQVKRLLVNPGCAISLQRHRQRAEHWVVVSGTARITRGEEMLTLTADQSTYIPVGMVHRIENPGPEPLRIIEVQSGDYLGEDDIERLDDRYGRGSL
jgi:mannose-1-phosphate guanylyltransferase/mannose-6-phosphate isomerase